MINWDKVKHIGEVESSPNLFQEQKPVSGPINWDNVRHVSETMPQPTVPTGKQQFHGTPLEEQKGFMYNPLFRGVAAIGRGALQLAKPLQQFHETPLAVWGRSGANVLLSGLPEWWDKNVAPKIEPIPGMVERRKQLERQSEAAHPTSSTIGQVTGDIAKYGLLYGTVGPVVEKLPLLSKIPAVSKIPLLNKLPIASKLPADAARVLTTELAKDIAIGAPVGLIEGAMEGKTSSELAKEAGKGIVRDALWNTLFYGAGKGLEALKKSRLNKIPVKGDAFGYVKPKQDIKNLTGELSNLKKAPRLSEFKVDAGAGVKTFNADAFTDGAGKTLKETISDVQEVMDNIIKDLEGSAVKSDVRIRDIAKKIKDKSGFAHSITDVYRNFERALPPEDFQYIKAKYLDPFDNAKKAMVDMQKQYTDELHETIVKKLGIGKATKESAAVQWFGEGAKPANVTDPQTGQKVWTQVKYTLEDLKREFPDKWRDIVEANKWFKQQYDKLYEVVNNARKAIYPNNPDKWLKYRKDYYRHFREMAEGVAGIKNLFETPSQIDPSLVGISEFTKPKSKWHSFMQERGLGKYKADAVGGFLDYIKASSYATHIDPQINKFRGLIKDIAEGTAETRNANGFIKFLHDWTNDLAGKTNPADRWLQDNIPGGRTTFRVINWINSRVKANTILGNISSSLSQIANVPQGIAHIKDPDALIKGAGDYMASILGTGKAPELYKQSAFLSERYGSKLFSKFDTKWIQQPKKFFSWLLGALDETGTKFIWSSAYNKGIKEGVRNPIKYADDIARKMVAGRGIGEVPLLQKSKLFQIVAPFQVEVGNLWHVMKDFVSERDFSGLAILFVANYLLNKGMEQVRGSGVVFDPIKAFEDAIKEKDATLLQRIGRLAGETLSNIPLGQTIAAAYPEYGIESVGLPTRKELFGREDPTRFGSGLLLTRGLQDPLYKLGPNWGGTQIKKTKEGIEALSKLGAYNGESLKYPVGKTPANILRGLLFGPSSFPETQEYYKENRRPLSEAQTWYFEKAVGAGKDPKQLYEQISKARRLETLRNKVQDIAKDRKMSPDEKNKKIKAIIEQSKAIIGSE